MLSVLATQARAIRRCVYVDGVRSFVSSCVRACVRARACVCVCVVCARTRACVNAGDCVSARTDAVFQCVRLTFLCLYV